jgi:hypothetical protein
MDRGDLRGCGGHPTRRKPDRTLTLRHLRQPSIPSYEDVSSRRPHQEKRLPETLNTEDVRHLAPPPLSSCSSYSSSRARPSRRLRGMSKRWWRRKRLDSQAPVAQQSGIEPEGLRQMSTSVRHLSSRRRQTYQLLLVDRSSHEPPTSSLGGVFGSCSHWWTCVVRPSAARSARCGPRRAHPDVAVARERVGAAAAEVLGAARVRRAVRCRGRREERGERERGEEGEAAGEHRERRVCGKTAGDAGKASATAPAL